MTAYRWKETRGVLAAVGFPPFPGVWRAPLRHRSGAAFPQLRTKPSGGPRPVYWQPPVNPSGVSLPGAGVPLGVHRSRRIQGAEEWCTRTLRLRNRERGLWTRRLPSRENLARCLPRMLIREWHVGATRVQG